MPSQPSPHRWVLGALTAAGITFTACTTAIVVAVFLDVIVGSVAGVLLGAPAVPVGIWVGSRVNRADRPSTADRPGTPAPDTRPILAALEAAAERHRHDDDQALDDRIAAAECEALGHVPPTRDADPVDMEITAWGSTKPLRSGPHCRRCGADLDPAEGNENAITGVRMSTDVTLSNRTTPQGDGRVS